MNEIQLDLEHEVTEQTFVLRRSISLEWIVIRLVGQIPTPFVDLEREVNIVSVSYQRRLEEAVGHLDPRLVLDYCWKPEPRGRETIKGHQGPINTLSAL